MTCTYMINSPYTQFELFPNATVKASELRQRRYLLKDLTLSVEHIIVSTIVFVMVTVLFFSFGVEKGKRMVRVSILEAAGISRAVEAVSQETRGVVSSRLLAGRGEAQAAPAVTISPQAEEETLRSPKGGLEPPEASPKMEAQPQKKDAQEDIFTIQVASFNSPQSAQKEAMLLKQKGYDIFVLPKGKHSIVCVGKFGQQNEAKAFSNKLKNRYNDCLVRRL